MSKYTKRLEVQVSSKYETRDGETRWRNANVGSAFIYEDGAMTISLDPGISISGGDSHRISLREPFTEEQRQQYRQRREQGQRSNGSTSNGSTSKQPQGGTDDIPF